MRTRKQSAVLLFLAALVASMATALSEDAYSTTITIRDHRFEPAEMNVPAGKRILLTVINADPLSEEFDSTALKVEKVIAGKSQGVVRFGPLAPGRYGFIGELSRGYREGPSDRTIGSRRWTPLKMTHRYADTFLHWGIGSA